MALRLIVTAIGAYALASLGQVKQPAFRISRACGAATLSIWNPRNRDRARS